MSLHDRIMSIRLTAEAEIWPAEERIIYKTGNRDARHAAAEMASEADELMAEMESAIDQLVGMYALKHCDDAMKSDECHNACAVLEKYNDYKEQ